MDCAYALAARLHAGQVDKAGRPYIGHLRRVAAGFPPGDVRDAALLHDAMEDQGATVDMLQAAGISRRAIELVQLLTKKPGAWIDEYLFAIRRDPDALAIKLADLADNADPERLALLPPDTQRRLRAKYHYCLELLKT